MRFFYSLISITSTSMSNFALNDASLQMADDE